VAIAGGLGWGANTIALAAAVRSSRLPSGSQALSAEARHERLRDILAMFTEGQDHPLLAEARRALGT
jgi:hypothetical protein